MNKQQALVVLEKHGSTHSRYGNVFTYSPDPYYDAQFNIKVRNPRFPVLMTEYQSAYIDDMFFDLIGRELEHLIDTILEDKYAPVEVFQEGRSGGWLVCRYPAPENGRDMIQLAYAIKRIEKLCDAAVDFVRSEAFWAEELGANCPVPVVEEEENFFSGTWS